MGSDNSAMPTGPRTRACAPRLLRVLAVPALIAIAGCGEPRPKPDPQVLFDATMECLEKIGPEPTVHQIDECEMIASTYAQGMAARSDETQGRLGPQGQQPGPQDAPTPRPEAGEGVE